MTLTPRLPGRRLPTATPTVDCWTPESTLATRFRQAVLVTLQLPKTPPEDGGWLRHWATHFLRLASIQYDLLRPRWWPGVKPCLNRFRKTTMVLTTTIWPIVTTTVK